MFKYKNISNIVMILSLLFEKSFCIFKTSNGSTNNIVLTYKPNNVLPPVYMLTEFSAVFVMDSFHFHPQKMFGVSYDIVYSYKWDVYISLLRNSPNQESSSRYFFNKLWLEREVSETSRVKYRFLKDSRPLLLNYGDITDVSAKYQSSQTDSDLRTVWHDRKISKFKNTNVEL